MHDANGHLLINGRRGLGLLVFSIGCLIRGWWYLPWAQESLSEGTRVLAYVTPVWVYGVLWIGAGLLGIWQSFRPIDLAAIVAIGSLHMLWGFGHAVAFFIFLLNHETTVAYLGAATYLAAGGLLLVWGLPARTIPERT